MLLAGKQAGQACSSGRLDGICDRVMYGRQLNAWRLQTVWKEEECVLV
jgi:hypothetical protein